MNTKLLKAVIMSAVIACVPCAYAEDLSTNTVSNEEVNNSANNSTDTNNTNLNGIENTTPENYQQDDIAEFEIPQEDENPGIEQGLSENSTNKVILTLDTDTAFVDGQQIKLETPPEVIDGVTLLPLRFIGDEVVGASTVWDPVTKTVTITKDNTIVIVTIGSNTATVDGMPVELTVPPQVINNRTLLPLRFISEAFGIPINYNKDTKQIDIQKIQDIIPVPNNAPVASFYFPDTYIAGQTVSVVNTSEDPDGDMIVDQLWSVQSTSAVKPVTNSQINKMFKTPRAGTYTVGLQVQDSKGLWSEWTYQTITIEPNEPPVITSFTASKNSYAQGEDLSFSYTYDNETWEAVKEGKWTYRPVSSPASRATVGKPEAIFTEGEYIITLYLDDDYGNRSQPMETTINITSEKLISELQYRFTKGKMGDWIDNFDENNYLSFKQAEISNITYDNGTLIMSDSPEMVTGPGILYSDSINGTGRLLIHHINNIINPIDTQKLAVIAENTTDKPVTVVLKNKAIKGPSTDILRVGQLALNEYLQGKPAETITLAPGEKKYIYNQTWTSNACISGHVDVETTGSVKFTVAALDTTNTIDNLDTLTYYPSDGAHYSGTYDKVGIHYNVTLDASEAQRITLGVINSGEWAVGYDNRTHAQVENTGNYGITYYVTVTAQEDMGVILNNRGGIFQGAIKWEGQTPYNMPGTGSFNGTTTKAVVMGTIKKGETKTFEYLLPNGSATPTLIGFIPASQW